MEEELKYTSDYSGEATDAILAFADKLRQQTEAEDGDTVQVYDTDGNPHKVSKTELMKKSALALPSLSDISAFVAINQAGDAVGVMSKEQVATVLGELIVDNTWFRYRGNVNESTDFNTFTETGMYYVSGAESYPNSPGFNYCILVVYAAGGVVEQTAYHEFSNSTKRRVKAYNGTWQAWA